MSTPMTSCSICIFSTANKSGVSDVDIL
jgi:hypothetical protein